jgi:Domain of unknown function (DUF4340)
MKLQKTPVALMLAALLLGAIVYIYESDRSVQQKSAQAPTQQKLFAFKEDEVQTLTIQTQTQTLAFTRTPPAPLPSSPTPAPSESPDSPSNSPAPSPPSASPSAQPSIAPSRWTMTAPKSAAASDAAIAYLLNLMATGTSEQSIVAPAAKQAEFGLNQPLATVEVKLLNQQTHRLILGKPNFNRSRLYAQVNPVANSTDLPVQLVAIDFDNAVTRPLSEWQTPPAPPKVQQK